MKPPISVILEQASQIKNRADRAKYLREHGSKPLMIILQYCFHPTVKWLLPEGAVPYKPMAKWDDQEGHLYLEARKLYLFVEGGYPGNLSQKRREELFIQILEGIHPQDAQLLVSVKDKKMPYEGIDYSIVREAFPGVVP